MQVGPAVKRLVPLPVWLRLTIFVWALAATGVMLTMKNAAMARGGASAFAKLGEILIFASIVLAAGAIAIAVLAARRRRFEVAAAVVAGLLLYAGGLLVVAFG